MSDRIDDRPGHLGHDELARYAADRLGDVGAWSAEAHLITCPACRRAADAHVDPDRLARNRSLLVVAAAADGPGRTRSRLARLGLPDHLAGLLAATPSLRRSWILSVIGVLTVVTGESQLVHHIWYRSPIDSSAWGPLVPFLLIGPLLVVGGVALAFLPRFDPTYLIAAAAPFSGVRLLAVRAMSALVAGLIPLTAAAFVVPGPTWLPAALVLPCLALGGVALAALTVVGPLAAAAVSAATWVLPVIVVGVSHPPLTVVHWPGQVVWAAVAVAMAGLALLRRDRFETGWVR